MSHNYRQARKNSFVQNEGYHISLKTILEERGLSREARLWDNLKSVREALMEMKKATYLIGDAAVCRRASPRSKQGKAQDRRRHLDPVASTEFVDEIIGGNKQMKQAGLRGRGKGGHKSALPGFQKNQVGGNKR